MLHCSEPGFILESLNSEVIARYNCVLNQKSLLHVQ